MYTAICEYQAHLCHQWSLDERRTTSTAQRHKGGKLGIMKKSFNFLCQTFGSFGKTSYLCTRKPKGATNNGAVVQLVRILACHARGRGFEPRPHRKRGESEMVLLFFLYHANLFRQVLKISFELYDIYLCHRFNI